MTEGHFKRPAPLPMPAYEPLIVTPVASKKRPGNVIAFIGRQMCFFEKEKPQPAVDVPIEVMILCPIYGRNAEGVIEHHRVFALVLRVVTEEWTLIEHDGFECAGSMCSTTARMTGPKHLIETRGSRIGPWLTPGRSQIFEADNVNAGSTWRQPYVALRPGKAWVSTKKLTGGDFPLRVEGLARVEDGMYAHAVKKDEVPA
ncbi:hypothetical protein GR212_15870 [Rhizobium lusitanum]|uniref:Uncharacterized protein n=1 Tax=Rhizobium lusitanum TaxID=293958 RepID=A0A6L9UAC7_9HYPH|nr:hypothetical protein [Rhizobium lusitanum]NEI71057.1 hypothetical protein [Rhizobium lusitanum]